MKLLRLLVLLFATAAGSAAKSDATTLELDYRIQPNQDLTVDSVSELVITARLIEDRGTGKIPKGQSSSPLTNVHMITRQSIRFISGNRDPEGRFPVQMIFLDRSTHTKGLDGVERKVPESIPLLGARVSVLIESGGKIREDTVEIAGVEQGFAEPLRKRLIALVSQASEIEPIQLSLGQDTSQDSSLQMPLAGATTLDVKVRTLNTLRDIENGKAKIGQTQSFEYGVPSGSAKIVAEGSGGGMMIYELPTKTPVSRGSVSLMKVTIDALEGVIQFEMIMKYHEKTGPTDRIER